MQRSKTITKPVLSLAPLLPSSSAPLLLKRSDAGSASEDQNMRRNRTSRSASSATRYTPRQNRATLTIGVIRTRGMRLPYSFPAAVPAMISL